MLFRSHLTVAIQQIQDCQPRRFGKGLEQRIHPNVRCGWMRAIVHLRSIREPMELDKGSSMIELNGQIHI